MRMCLHGTLNGGQWGGGKGKGVLYWFVVCSSCLCGWICLTHVYDSLLEIKMTNILYNYVSFSTRIL